MRHCEEQLLQDQIPTEISGDRRGRRRYPIDLRVSYRVLKNQRICHSGSGKTIDLSGTGIAFQAEDDLPPGTAIELSIAWPVLLNQTCPLQLVVSGKVVRSQRTLTAIRMLGYEFRTKALLPRAVMACSAFRA